MMRMVSITYVPEFRRVIGDSFGSLGNGKRIAVKKKVLELAGVTIAANVPGTIAKRRSRASKLLLSGGFGEEIKALSFQSSKDILGDAMVDHLEETIILAGFDD